jgi:hypothetical protein
VSGQVFETPDSEFSSDVSRHACETGELRNESSAGPPIQCSDSELVELASGIDALYLSGRANLPGELLGRLEVARGEADRSKAAVPFLLNGVEYQLKPHSWQRYRYCLDHPWGRVGFTVSKFLPVIRVQPHTEFLQGFGPRAVVAWYRAHLEGESGPVLLSVNRLDLFADFQVWTLTGDVRREFVSRSRSLITFEENEIFTGFNFGKRKTGTVNARLYDKSNRIEENGEHFWKMIWGEKFDPTKSVLRIEFEMAGAALREFGLTCPEDVLDAAGSLWTYLSNEWLTHRVPGLDGTKSRWAISSQWERVQRATIGEGSHGLNRMYLGKRRGGVAGIMSGLEGYLASFGAYAEASSLDDMLPHLKDALRQRERDTGISFGERVEDKHRKFGLP